MSVSGLCRSLWKHAQLEIRMVCLVLILGGVLSVLSPHFLTPFNLYNIMDQTVVLGIAAIGATLVIITGGIDLSVGSVLGVSAIVLGVSYARLDMGTAGSLAMCLGTGMLAGAASGLLVARAGLVPFVATLGMMAVARSQAYVISGAKSVSTLPGFVEDLGNATVGSLPLNFLCLLAFYVLMWLFLNRTKTGRAVYAVGSNEEAARLAGISVSSVKVLCYVLSGFCAALAGIFQAGRILSVDPVGGNGMELDTIAAIVIGGASLFGGRGSIFGTLLGVFVMVLIRNGLNLMKVDPYWQGTAIGSVIIAALLLERVFRSRSAR